MSFMLCAWRVVSLTALTICANGESVSHECANSAAHKSHKPTINTPEHGADLRSISQNTRKRFRSSPCHHIDAETGIRKSHHLSYLNFEPGMVSCFGWVCNVCHSCWHLCRCGWDKHRKPPGRRLRGQEHHSKSMLFILLLLLQTQTLDGPLDQTARHKVDSWSSLQTPSCCKAENQTCL